ncbi:MAG: transporter substrate-binding protein [Desulfacinum sp.]|jgi:phospholipid transport system substrate-binding protein|nr:transporter substrate-binding protein [Desulfacinum sp.]
MDVIKSGTDRALAVLNVCRDEESDEVRRQKREEIKKIAYDYVDFEEMGRRALGRHWKKLTPAQQDEFLRLFKDLLYFTYIGRVDTYTCGQTQTIAYDEEKILGRYALVKTRVSYQDQMVPVEYRMIQTDKGWMVYDVVIEGVSYVNNYRKQFDSILVNKPVDDLFAMLRDKVAELEKNDSLGSGRAS